MELFYGAQNNAVAQRQKIISLSDYRRKCDAVAAGYEPVSFHWETDPAVWTAPADQNEDAFPAGSERNPKVSGLFARVRAHLLRQDRPEHRLGNFLELASSAAVLVLAITVWVQFLG